VLSSPAVTEVRLLGYRSPSWAFFRFRARLNGLTSSAGAAKPTRRGRRARQRGQT
jgi:hypothetical protein